jgi:hypothetical protein
MLSKKGILPLAFTMDAIPIPGKLYRLSFAVGAERSILRISDLEPIPKLTIILVVYHLV